ncbi:MAG: hypothetical protein HXL30_00605 [Prevotellaceae bacterium]|nr:hypothetical protein [Prevotellaceae bacterium]
MLCASAPLRRRADAHIVFAAHLFVVRPSPVENCLAQHDFLYFSSADLLPTPPYSPISAESRPEGCRLAVVHGIDRDAAARAAWVSFRDHPDVHVSFDLGRFGLAFFAPQLQRQHYVVAYF